MKAFSYLAYALGRALVIVGGTGYAVFVPGHSGWWFLAAVLLLSGGIRPERWSALWDEKVAENYRKEGGGDVL